MSFLGCFLLTRNTAENGRRIFSTLPRQLRGAAAPRFSRCPAAPLLAALKLPGYHFAAHHFLAVLGADKGQNDGWENGPANLFADFLAPLAWAGIATGLWLSMNHFPELFL